jgi:hypothetical protein
VPRRGGFLAGIFRRKPPRSYRSIWDDADPENGSYEKHLAVFHSSVDRIESDPDERLNLWESYVRHMVAGEGWYRRNSSSNMFWRDLGMDPRDFGWDTWRVAMGYKTRRGVQPPEPPKPVPPKRRRPGIIRRLLGRGR